MSAYRSRIETILAAMARGDVDAALVEGYMRLAHSTLDGLSRVGFAREVAIGVRCVDAAGLAAARDLASSYGLREGAA